MQDSQGYHLGRAGLRIGRNYQRKMQELETSLSVYVLHTRYTPHFDNEPVLKKQCFPGTMTCFQSYTPGLPLFDHPLSYYLVFS